MIFYPLETIFGPCHSSLLYDKPAIQPLPPNLLQTLEDDILKFRQNGAPKFRLNTTCKQGKYAQMANLVSNTHTALTTMAFHWSFFLPQLFSAKKQHSQVFH